MSNATTRTTATSTRRTGGAARWVTLALVFAGLLAPAAAQADLRFGPVLASSASGTAGTAQPPAVAGNAAGVVAAAYSQKVGSVYHMYTRVKPTGSAAFQAPQALSAVDSDSPAAAVAADGTITVAWQQGNPCAGSSVWMATAPPGGPFGPAAKISDNAYYPHLAVAPDGTVVLLYGRDKGSCVHEERVQVRPRGGAPTDTVISDAAYGSVDASDAAVGIDAGGTAIVAFGQRLSASPFTHVLRVARRPAGGAWTGTTLIGPGTNGSALAVAQDGHAVVADMPKVAAGYAVEVRSLAPGASLFGPPQTITDTSANETLAGIAVANGGAAVVTTSARRLAERATGAGSFTQAASIGLANAENLTPAYTAKGELTLFDGEKLPGAALFSLVARVRPPGGALGAPQPTGLESDAIGDTTLAPFGANDVAAGWESRPAGASEFQAGVALGDGTPPALGPVTAPAGGLAGVPLAFGVAPSDDLGIADVQWAFGDGAAAASAAAAHAFAAPGASSWSVTARDLVGNTASATSGLTIQPQPAPGELAVRIAKPRRGTRAPKLRSLRGTASGPVARVEVSVVRVLKGKARSARARCSSLGSTGRLASRTRRAGRTGCTSGTYLKATGSTRWTLSLRRRLPSGTYIAFARARSATGARSAVARATFTLRK